MKKAHGPIQAVIIKGKGEKKLTKDAGKIMGKNYRSDSGGDGSGDGGERQRRVREDCTMLFLSM